MMLPRIYNEHLKKIQRKIKQIKIFKINRYLYRKMEYFNVNKKQYIIV